FFSSRRRHTRSKRDWSSDVCSSDLERPPRGREAPQDRPQEQRREHLEERRGDVPHADEEPEVVREDAREHEGREKGEREDGHARSEERRVGKESRARG